MNSSEITKDCLHILNVIDAETNEKDIDECLRILNDINFHVKPMQNYKYNSYEAFELAKKWKTKFAEQMFAD